MNPLDPSSSPPFSSIPDFYQTTSSQERAVNLIIINTLPQILVKKETNLTEDFSLYQEVRKTLMMELPDDAYHDELLHPTSLWSRIDQIVCNNLHIQKLIISKLTSVSLPSTAEKEGSKNNHPRNIKTNFAPHHSFGGGGGSKTIFSPVDRENETEEKYQTSSKSHPSSKKSLPEYEEIEEENKEKVEDLGQGGGVKAVALSHKSLYFQGDEKFHKKIASVISKNYNFKRGTINNWVGIKKVLIANNPDKAKWLNSLQAGFASYYHDHKRKVNKFLSEDVKKDINARATACKNRDKDAKASQRKIKKRVQDTAFAQKNSLETEEPKRETKRSRTINSASNFSEGGGGGGSSKDKKSKNFKAS